MSYFYMYMFMQFHIGMGQDADFWPMINFKDIEIPSSTF